MFDESTEEMRDFFEKRTREHISRVRDNLAILAEKKFITWTEAVKRGLGHDHTKYSNDLKEPYTWLTWYYANDENDSIYPEGMKDKVDEASDIHVSNEDHHPEYWMTPSDELAGGKIGVIDMDESAMAEMVSDWCAMSQELDSNIYDWIEDTAKEKYAFDDDQWDRIYAMTDVIVGDTEMFEKRNRLRKAQDNKKIFHQIDQYGRIVERFTVNKLWDGEIKEKADKLKIGESIPFTGTTRLVRIAQEDDMENGDSDTKEFMGIKVGDKVILDGIEYKVSRISTHRKKIYFKTKGEYVYYDFDDVKNMIDRKHLRKIGSVWILGGSKMERKSGMKRMSRDKIIRGKKSVENLVGKMRKDSVSDFPTPLQIENVIETESKEDDMGGEAFVRKFKDRGRKWFQSLIQYLKSIGESDLVYLITPALGIYGIAGKEGIMKKKSIDESKIAEWWDNTTRDEKEKVYEVLRDKYKLDLKSAVNWDYMNDDDKDLIIDYYLSEIETGEGLYANMKRKAQIWDMWVDNVRDDFREDYPEYANLDDDAIEITEEGDVYVHAGGAYPLRFLNYSQPFAEFLESKLGARIKKAQEEASVWIGDLAAYNEGRLEGRWVSVDEFDDASTLMDIINEILEPGHEEWYFGDYNDFPNMGEYPDLDKVAAVARALQETDPEIVKAYIDNIGVNYITDDLVDNINETYYGTYDDLGKFAYELLYGQGVIDQMQDVGGINVEFYFDFEKYANDLVIGGDVWTAETSGGITVFWNT